MISRSEIDYPYVTRPHHMMIMSQGAYEKYVDRLRSDGKLLYDEDLVELKFRRDDIHRFGIPATRLAEQLGRRIVANIVMLGAFTATTGLISKEAMLEAVRASVPPKTIDLNVKAFEAGYEYAEQQKEAS